MSKIKLRPHHGLCLHFFEGKGYSQEFVHNMYAISSLYSHADCEVSVTFGADSICASCLNMTEGRCSSQEKAERFDRLVATFCGLQEGQIVTGKEFCKRVEYEIIHKNRLERICGECEWYSICKEKTRNK